MAIKKRIQRQRKSVTFTFNAPQAKNVMLAGDFNNWNATATSLKKNNTNKWEKNLTLKSGRYEYKFIVDGDWISDPNNNNKIINAFGTENSIIEV